MPSDSEKGCQEKMVRIWSKMSENKMNIRNSSLLQHNRTFQANKKSYIDLRDLAQWMYQEKYHRDHLERTEYSAKGFCR